MDDNNLIRSMSRKGCSPDNSACEGFFGRLKNEIFYKREWKDVTLDEFINIVNNYIKWYNETRIKKSLGYKSPIEYIKRIRITIRKKSKKMSASPFVHSYVDIYTKFSITAKSLCFC